MDRSLQKEGGLSAGLHRYYRGEMRDVRWLPPAAAPAPDDLSLASLAASALNYLRGNPDPARDYECKFSLGPLGIPAHVPSLPPNRYGFDPIALGDTDCRMAMQYAHMREMAGDGPADAVERGVCRRIHSYQRDDGLLWMNPAAWVGGVDTPEAVEALQYEWAFAWASGKLLICLAEEYQRGGDSKRKDDCRAIFQALAALASRDAAGRAFLPHGASPWRNGA